MGSGETQQALVTETYIWIAPQNRLAGEEWSFEEFVEEKLDSWTGDSEEFKESDKIATSEVVVDDSEGSRVPC